MAFGLLTPLNGSDAIWLVFWTTKLGSAAGLMETAPIDQFFANLTKQDDSEDKKSKEESVHDGEDQGKEENNVGQCT